MPEENTMSFFTWKEAFNTGIAEIDQQHQEIFAVLNRLYEASQTPVNRATAKQALLEMIDYANNHFSREERLMKKINYPELNQQMTQHNFYKEQMIQLDLELVEDNPSGYKHVVEFLKDWFLSHILQEDMKFGVTMKSMTGH
jgi:hemerythrin-like metal-binding protein